MAKTLTPRQKVLARWPNAFVSKVIWPCEIYWVHASSRHKDSLSDGRRTRRAAWYDAAKQLKKGRRDGA